MVRIEGNDPNDGPLMLDLMRPADGDRTVLKTATIPKGQSSARFEGLEPGEYHLMLRSGAPLERLAATVQVKAAEEVESALKIKALRLNIEVVRGGSPVPAALVETINHDHGWSASLTADGDGKITTNVWQTGDYLFAVRASPEAAPYGMLAAVEGDDESSVRLDLPDRAIRGRVLDGTTGKPIPAAAVRIESTGDDGSGASLEIKAGPSGEFQFDSLGVGTHGLTAIADGYLESAPVSVRLEEADRRLDVDMRIERGKERVVGVVNQSRIPLQGASVIHTVDGVMQRFLTTDELGEVRLPMPARAQNVVYVVPREGSLAVSRLRGDVVRATIVVPDAVASLQLRTSDSGGRPIPNVRFLMRLDGEIIPPDIQRHVERLRGDPISTDAAGSMTLDHLPSGFFEFWPLRTMGELQDILLTISESAPVQVAVKPGRNSAEMTFDRKR